MLGEQAYPDYKQPSTQRAQAAATRAANGAVTAGALAFGAAAAAAQSSRDVSWQRHYSILDEWYIIFGIWVALLCAGDAAVATTSSDHVNVHQTTGTVPAELRCG